MAQEVVDLSKGLWASAEALNSLVLSGSTAMMGMLLLLLTKGENGIVKILGAEISLKYRWVVLLAFTGAHAYMAQRVVDQVQLIEEHTTEGENERAWSGLVDGGEGGLMFGGMHPRKRQEGMTFLGNNLYGIDGMDLPGWLSVGLFFVVFATAFGGKPYSWRNAIDKIGIGFAFAMGNWWIGSYWAITLSRLAP